MTIYDKIMSQMTVMQMAQLRTTCEEQTLPHENCSFTVWVNDAGWYYDYGQAIEEEMAWLQEDEE
jgi:hypothetical protein